jgi:multicomponent Na+:H+ antiporter subunit E
VTLRQGLIAAKRAVFFAGIWLVLTGADPGGLVIGAVAVAAAAGLSLVLMPPRAGVALWPLAIMIPEFLWRSLLGGVDVARRVFNPRLPLSPGWKIMRTRLPDGGKAALGGEFSLMPGTLVAGSKGDRLLIHMLDTRQDITGDIAREEACFARSLRERDDDGKREAK